MLHKTWGVVLTGAALALFISAGGCKQGDGERCQIDSDCDDTLVCCLVDDQPTKGICKTEARCQKQSTDSGPLDGGQGDAITVDTAITDTAATPDKGGTVDKGMTPDQATATPDKATATPDKAVATPDKATVTPDATITVDKKLTE